MFNVKNFWANTLTTKSKWVVNIFLNFLFIDLRFLKHFSSFVLPRIMAMDNSMNFNHLDSWWKGRPGWFLVKLVKILMHILQSRRGFSVAWKLASIISWEKMIVALIYNLLKWYCAFKMKSYIINFSSTLSCTQNWG